MNGYTWNNYKRVQDSVNEILRNPSFGNAVTSYKMPIPQRLTKFLIFFETILTILPLPLMNAVDQLCIIQIRNIVWKTGGGKSFSFSLKQKFNRCRLTLHEVGDKAMKKLMILLMVMVTLSFTVVSPAKADWQRTITVMDTKTVGKADFQTSIFAEYVHWKENTVTQLVAFGQFGVLENLDLLVSSGYIFLSPDNGESQSDTADTLIGLKFRLLTETDFLVDSAIQMDIKLPSADQTKGLGTGNADAQIKISLAKTVWQLTAIANGGYTLVGKTDNDSLENQVYWGGEVVYMLKEHVSLNVSYDEMNSRYDSQKPLRWIGAGSKWMLLENLQLFTRIEVGLTDETNDWDLRGGIGYQF